MKNAKSVNGSTAKTTKVKFSITATKRQLTLAGEPRFKELADEYAKCGMLAKLPRGTKLEAIVILNQTTDEKDKETGDAIYRDNKGHFYLGPWPFDGRVWNTTPKKALHWFAANDEQSVDGSGSIAPVVAVALDRKKNATPEDLNKTGVKLTVEIDSWVFGLLSQGSVIHKCDVRTMLEQMLNHSDAVVDWTALGFVID